jgi:beta-xylosidase
MKYNNPIIPGFAPDPSVTHVNGTFYLVTSSFHLFPGLPIYASKDLRSWTQVGKFSIPRYADVFFKINFYSSKAMRSIGSHNSIFLAQQRIPSSSTLGTQ